MPGITFTVTLDDEAARAQLAAMIARMTRPEGFFKRAGAYLKDEAVPRNFDTETAPGGAAWSPLSAVTLKRRAKAGVLSTKILVASRALRASIVSQPAADHVAVGSALVYAAVQQFGAGKRSLGAYSGTDKRGRRFKGAAPWGNIPARPFLGLSAADREEILLIAGEWLAEEQHR